MLHCSTTEAYHTTPPPLLHGGWGRKLRTYRLNERMSSTSCKLLARQPKQSFHKSPPLHPRLIIRLQRISQNLILLRPTKESPHEKDMRPSWSTKRKLPQCAVNACERIDLGRLRHHITLWLATKESYPAENGEKNGFLANGRNSRSASGTSEVMNKIWSNEVGKA